jgi:hypothetical protein
MDKKIVIGLGIGCVALCFLLVIFAALGVWFLGQSSEMPSDVSIQVSAPTNANVGDDFVIEVAITNTGQQSRELNSIDIYTSYLDGVFVQRTSPAYSEFINNLFFDVHHYYFYEKLPPGSTTTVQFFAQAVMSGNFSGDLDVCIDSITRCTTYFIRTVIRD